MKNLNRIFSRLRIEHLWAITVMVGIIAFLNTHPIRPHDFWWHVAIGRDIFVEGQIPEVDTYSFTRYGTPYPSYQQFWLMEVVLYLVYRVGGPVLVILMQTLVVGTAYVLLLMTGYRSTMNWRAAAFGLVFAFGLGFGNWNVRPQIASYLYGALILFAIGEYERTQRRIWLGVFPLAMALWVNSHGSFPIGLALIGIWFADEGLKLVLHRKRQNVWAFKTIIPPGIGLTLALLGCLINPRGIGFVGYLTMMAGNSVIQNYILEWMPPDFQSLEGVIFYAFFMLSALILVLSPRRANFKQVLFFVIFGVLGLKYIRGIIWYGIVMSTVVADHLAAIFDQAGWSKSTPPSRRENRINILFVVLLTVLGIFSLPWFKPLWPVVSEKAGLISVETPIEATNFLINNELPGQLFHDMAFGSYLMWEAQPAYKVFVDSRVELYPLEIWDDYFIISSALHGWEEKLTSYGVNTLMLEPEKEANLINAASDSPNWQQVYRDGQAVVFIRQGPGSP